MSNVIAAGWLFIMKDSKGSRSLCKGRILFADCKNHHYLIKWDVGGLCWYTSDWFPLGVAHTMRDDETDSWSSKVAGLIRYLTGQLTQGDDEQGKHGYGPYFISVDGGNAPSMKHPSLKCAKREAERIAGVLGQENDKTIRVLKQVAELTTKPITTYERKWQ